MPLRISPVIALVDRGFLFVGAMVCTGNCCGCMSLSSLKVVVPCLRHCWGRWSLAFGLAL
jgi:hypothetical protein